MNNGRDCPHGRQFGKCDTCDLITAELELEKVKTERSALAAQVEALLDCLCSIQQQCIGEITMSYQLDAESIGRQIYRATGMTEPYLRERLKVPSDHLRELRAEAVIDAVFSHEVKYGNSQFGRHLREYADSIRRGEVK